MNLNHHKDKRVGLAHELGCKPDEAETYQPCSEVQAGIWLLISTVSE